MKKLLFLILILAGCSSVEKEGVGYYATPSISGFKVTSFDKLPGFENDDFLDAVPAMKNSCMYLIKQKRWKSFCENLNRQEFLSSYQVKAFIEENMIPYTPGMTGKFTGYYQPMVKGSWVPSFEFTVPVYQKPADLVRGKKYDTRAQINKRDDLIPILWIEHQADLFLLQVQGSGVVEMDDGELIGLHFDVSNERPFYAIGKDLAKKGIFNMADIRDWLIDNPVEGERLMNKNERYIFFKHDTSTDAIGSMKYPLSSGRSMAVDPAYIPMGSFLWLDTRYPNKEPLQRLVFAQDTGKAIKGKVRGDFFFGLGDEALHLAGRMNSQGTYYLLYPRGN